MISDELKKIVDLFNQQGEMRFKEGATEEQISDFEKEHKIKFPKEYKEWLLFSDGGELFLPGGIQLKGVSHKPLINVDDSDRPDDSYVVIGKLSNGDPILIKKSESQISIYNQEAETIEADETYPDFIAFLNDLSDFLGIGE